MLISAEKLDKIYSLGTTELRALDGVTFSVDRGEFAGLVGPSGSGKTTLLNIIGSLDVPTHQSSNTPSSVSFARKRTGT